MDHDDEYARVGRLMAIASNGLTLAAGKLLLGVDTTDDDVRAARTLEAAAWVLRKRALRARTEREDSCAR